ncbi:DUF1643 domain-containing protein [Helicobacter sp. T3_23-1056]
MEKNIELLESLETLFDLYKYDDYKDFKGLEGTKCRFVLGNASAKNPLLCIGLNPSLATDKKSDPTIKKIQQIIKNTGKYDGLIMLNIYPLIATKPSDLLQDDLCIIALDNYHHIENIFNSYLENDILACWGDNILLREYLLICLKWIYELSNNINPNRKWLCLNLTQKGNPTHPLYQPNDCVLMPFDMASYIDTINLKNPHLS